MPDRIAAGHAYVREGFGVVPLYGIAESGACRCRAGQACPFTSRGKHPSTGAAWHERALTSGADVQAWYDTHPTDNVGILTGAESGIFVLDVDGAAGVASVSAMATDHGALPPTRIVRTGSGGLHYYFRHPGHFVVHSSASWLAPGIDIRGKGGQVVAPPSVSARGSYELIADNPIGEAPGWLLADLAEHAAAVERGQGGEIRGAEPIGPAELVHPAVDVLRSTIVEVDKGRHAHFHALVAACFDHGYTQGQAVTIAAPWCLAVGKFVGRVEQEVARSWAKVADQAARSEEWLPGSTALSGVPSVPAAPVPVPGRPTPLNGVSASVAGDSGPSVATDEAPEAAATWAAVELGAVLAGTYAPEVAELFPRLDGIGLVYRGRVHSFHGESESGKSMLAQAEAARLLKLGETVAYLDFESDVVSVVRRLLDLGATAAEVGAGFEYRRPDANPRNFPHERAAFLALVARPWDLVIVDGLTDALATFGAGSLDNDEIAGFMRAFPRYVARRTGAAVVLVDHVTKNAETRGRYAVGGQAKMNALDGAAYLVGVESTIGRGMAGILTMRIAKDRPGGVRPHAGPPNAKDRTQEAARITVDSTAGPITVLVAGPSTNPADPAVPIKRTSIRRNVSRIVERAGGPIRKTAVIAQLDSRDEYVRAEIAALVAEGFIAETPEGSTRWLTHNRPYDPETEVFRPAVRDRPGPSGTEAVGAAVLPSRLPVGGRGTDPRDGTKAKGDNGGPSGADEVGCASCGRRVRAVDEDGNCRRCADEVGS